MATDDLWAYCVLHRGTYGTARMDTIRAKRFHEFITTNVPPGSVILDASCGRGILLKALIDDGYKATGTEASEYLVAEVLPPLPVVRLTYSELRDVPDKSVDVIVSNDVLEHLDNESEVATALAHMVRISRRWVLISVGLNESVHMIEGKQVRLHRVVKRPEWWQRTYERYCVPTEHFVLRNSFFCFGERRECPLKTTS